MDTFKIRALLLAVSCRSMSRAAQALSYTPSALSHSVEALEKELGVKLLTRSNSGVTWSEAGLQLRGDLEALVRAEDALIDRAAALTGIQHTLRIAAFSSICSNLLPKLLNEFKQLYPNIRFQILVENKLRELLDRDLADVLLGQEESGFQWLPLLEDPFVAVVPADLFPDRTTVSFEDLYPYSYILTENRAAARNADLTQFRDIIQLYSDDDTAAVSMVAQGMGVTFLPALMMQQPHANVRVLQLEKPFTRTLGACYRGGLEKNTSAMQFIRYLQSSPLLQNKKN